MTDALVVLAAGGWFALAMACVLAIVLYFWPADPYRPPQVPRDERGRRLKERL